MPSEDVVGSGAAALRVLPSTHSPSVQAAKESGHRLKPVVEAQAGAELGPDYYLRHPATAGSPPAIAT